MSRNFRTWPLAVAFLATVLGVAVHAQPGEPPAAKKPADPKAGPKDKDSSAVKLPDGTFLWLGTPIDGTGERITLTPQEFQKLLDQLDQLKKANAAKKATAPSGCAIRAKIEKRGDQLVAILKLTAAFRTTLPQTVVSLGGRKGFLVAAALDGNKLPVLDSTDDGFMALIEAAGDHTLTLDLEAPVTARGAKPELGFEIGLPRAAITTLVFDPPSADVKRVTLITRTPDPTLPLRPVDPRRTPTDIKQLAAKPGEAGLPLGPVDTLELTWDPPAAAPPADQVQSAEIDVTVVLTESVVETTAKIKLSGSAREWKIVAPATADLSVDRTVGPGTEIGPTQPAIVTKPGDANKPVWKIELPVNSTATVWVVTAVTRLPRPKPDDAKYRGPFPVGPFTILDALRQTGTVRVTAGPNTHFAFAHGPDLRKVEPSGPAEDEVTTAFFRLTTGPTGALPVNSPMFTVEATPLRGRVGVKPTYRLRLVDGGWEVRAEVKVVPIRTAVEGLTIEIPATWHGLDVETSPPELLDGVQPGSIPDGFWAVAGARLAGSLRVPHTIRLATARKQPFDLVLTATVSFAPGETSASIPLPRFVGATEKESSVVATVPDALEVRGESRSRDAEFAAWGIALTTPPTTDGKPRSATTVTGKSETSFSRVFLAWNPHRSDLIAETRADVTIGERQAIVTESIKIRSPEGFSQPLRFRGPPQADALKSTPQLVPSGNGEWTLTAPVDAKEISVSITFAMPLPVQRADGREAGETWELDVGLFWPKGTTRGETTVRVWSESDNVRIITNSRNGWRSLPVEASPDRDTLPTLTLAATGGEIPLTLQIRDAAGTGAVVAWVDRGLIQAWSTDDGTTSYRARFLLRRWLVSSIEVRLPALGAGFTPEFLRDGQKFDAIPIPDASNSDRVYRVPLPEARPGRTIAIEVRYQLPAHTRETTYLPPLLPAIAFAGPVRWQVTVPAGSVPLLASGATAEFRWRFRPTGFLPTPAGTDLDRWFRLGGEPGNGEDSTSSTETISARQASPAAIKVYRVNRTGFVIICSVAAFLVVLVVTRLHAATLGSVAALLAGVLGTAVVFVPHVAAQVAGACQFGLVAVLGVFVFSGIGRWYYRRRAMRVPGFSRTRPEPSAVAVPLPSAARNRPTATGTGSGVPPVAQVGG